MGTEDTPLTQEFMSGLTNSNIFTTGIFALEKGWMMTSLLVTAIAAASIDRNFKTVMAWLAGAALLSLVGISHKFEVLGNDVVSRLGPAWDWLFGYAITIATIALVHFVLRDKREKQGKLKL